MGVVNMAAPFYFSEGRNFHGNYKNHAITHWKGPDHRKSNQ